MKLIKYFRSAVMVMIVAVSITSGTKAQSVHNEQYIALQNFILPQYAITIGAPTTLLTNYTFLLPDAAPTSLNQTLLVTSMVGSTYTLGWGGTTNNTNWMLTGNMGSSSLTNFIGTTDAQDFVTKTNSIERMRVTSSGKIGIGTILPGQLVEVKNGNILLSNSATPGQLQFQGTLTGTTTISAGAQGLTNINYTLPLAAPSANGQVLSSTTGGAMSWISATSAGTVTSVGLALPTNEFTISNSPVTTSGTLTGTWKTQNAAVVFAGPVTGTAAVPTFRALSATDIPSLSTNYIVNGTTLQTANFNISGNGGIGGQLQLQGTSTGISTFQAGAQGITNINYTLPITAPTSGQVLSSSNTGAMSWINASTGTVTSVGLAMPSIFTVTNSPVTSSGTLTAALATESANLVFAGPSTGAAATPTFRALTATDIPSLASSYIVNGTSLQTANYNISGNGTIDGQLQLKGTSTGVTTFQSGAQGSTNINYTLPIAQGSSGTVLQNNGSGVLSWVDISSSSSGVGSVIFAIKGSDETVTNSSTLQNDDDLYFTIGANETWEIVSQLEAKTGSGGDPKLLVAITIPSGTLHVYVNQNGEGGADDGQWLKTSGTSSDDGFKIEDGDKMDEDDEQSAIVFRGLIVCGSTGGTVHIQWAPDKAQDKKSITVMTNSYLKATRAK